VRHSLGHQAGEAPCKRLCTGRGIRCQPRSCLAPLCWGGRCRLIQAPSPESRYTAVVQASPRGEVDLCRVFRVRIIMSGQVR
jgi:hypothetical protein